MLDRRNLFISVGRKQSWPSIPSSFGCRNQVGTCTQSKMPAAVNGIMPREGTQAEEEQRLRRERREKMRQLQQDLDPRLDYEVRLCTAPLINFDNQEFSTIPLGPISNDLQDTRSESVSRIFAQGRTSAPPVREVDAFQGDALGRADMREQQRVKTASAGAGRQKTLNYLDKNRKNRRISDVSIN